MKTKVMQDNDACEADVVDNLTGAIEFGKLLSPKMGIVVDPIPFTSTREWLERANET